MYMYMFSNDTTEDLAIKQKLLDNTVSIDLLIEFTDKKTKTLTSENILLDTLELTNSICDDSTLKFGGCISSQLSISVFGVDDELNGREIKVYIYQKYIDELYPSNTLYPKTEIVDSPASNLYPCKLVPVRACIFTGIIDSSKRQQNRNVREIIAYDKLYQVSKINVYNWFYGMAYHSPKITIKDLKETLVDILESNGITFDTSIYGSDDNYTLDLSYQLVEDICDRKLTALELLENYCEITAHFAYCTGNGTIKILRLPQAGMELVPYEVKYYTDLTFESYTVASITNARFPYNKGKTQNVQIKNVSATKEKKNYYDSDNKLTAFNKTNTIISNLIRPNGSLLSGWLFYDFRPFNANLFGRWWLEPGDTITLDTGADDIKKITTTIFNRTINGTAGLSVTASTTSSERQGVEEKQWGTT